jgi:hypothetical protein
LKIQFLFKFFHFLKNSLKNFFNNKNKMIALFFFFSIFIGKTKLVDICEGRLMCANLHNLLC